MNAPEEPQVRSANLEQPDQVRPLGRGSGSFVDLGRGHIIGRAVLEPGWRWSVDVRPVVGDRFPLARVFLAVDLHISGVVEGHGAGVGCALHVVLAAQRVEPCALAPDVAGEQRQVNQP